MFGGSQRTLEAPIDTSAVQDSAGRRSRLRNTGGIVGGTGRTLTTEKSRLPGIVYDVAKAVSIPDMALLVVREERRGIARNCRVGGCLSAVTL
jgi:hypothetical protein